MTADEAPTPSSPGLWRLAAAAARLGLHPETLAAAADAGELTPITIVRIGPRGTRFVRAADVEVFLSNGAPRA